MSDLKAKFTVRTKPAKATDPSQSRYSLSHVVASPSKDGVWLTSTNARIVAATLAEGEIDKARYVPTEVMPTAVKGGEVQLNGQWENDKGKFAAEIDAEGCKFPNVADIMPAAGDCVLTIDARLLLDLALAINEPGTKGTIVTLFIPAAKRKPEVPGAVLESIGVLGHNGIGIISPCEPDTLCRDNYACRVLDYQAEFSLPDHNWLNSPDDE